MNPSNPDSIAARARSGISSYRRHTSSARSDAHSVLTHNSFSISPLDSSHNSEHDTTGRRISTSRHFCISLRTSRQLSLSSSNSPGVAVELLRSVDLLSESHYPYHHLTVRSRPFPSVLLNVQIVLWWRSTIVPAPLISHALA